MIVWLVTIDPHRGEDFQIVGAFTSYEVAQAYEAAFADAAIHRVEVDDPKLGPDPGTFYTVTQKSAAPYRRTWGIEPPDEGLRVYLKTPREPDGRYGFSWSAIVRATSAESAELRAVELYAAELGSGRLADAVRSRIAADLMLSMGTGPPVNANGLHQFANAVAHLDTDEGLLQWLAPDSAAIFTEAAAIRAEVRGPDGENDGSPT